MQKDSMRAVPDAVIEPLPTYGDPQDAPGTDLNDNAGPQAVMDEGSPVDALR
jgi:hypothetical protein